jgi:Zn finger protein HypA/HybF involved in hydrogenase expression
MQAFVENVKAKEKDIAKVCPKCGSTDVRVAITTVGE